MKAFELIERKLREGMIEGQMHGCLRDVGRLAGGYAAAGDISPSELFELESLVADLSKNPTEGVAKWAENIVFGRKQPVKWDSSESFRERHDRPLEWEDEIGGGTPTHQIVDPDWLEEDDIPVPGDDWNGANDLILYLSTLFQSDDLVAYTTDAWRKDDKWLPGKGNWDRTAGQLIEALQKCDGDVGMVLGDCQPGVGAWIRFNPFDGGGIKDANVTEFRYALVECDNQSLERQVAILRELCLPIACMVHSGKKSIHAIVRIEADTMEVYRERVDFLYEVCKKNGLEVDRQNRNPSRLSRMPGVMRGEARQYLIGTNIGKKSWVEWHDWIEDLHDDLPDIEPLEAVFHRLPQKSPELIAGILREGHKMRIAGPSKAGKSFMLDQLVIAIAEGREWMGWKCAQGRVLYINLELDRASCLHRFADIYRANGWEPRNIHNIDVWNLRGKAAPMDKLAPKLIRRAQQKKYKAIIIDPIYKVITGDENSAEAMSHFCNQFDRIATELGCAVIDCHHHSKGIQGSKKSADRASGSGVFARDPDALIDLIQLSADDPRAVLENRAVCDAMMSWMDTYAPKGWREEIPIDDILEEQKFLSKARGLIPHDLLGALLDTMASTRLPIQNMTAWRLEGTLREFASFRPRNIWFQYPIHIVEDNLLQDAEPEGMEAPWQTKQRKKAATKSERKVDRKESLTNAMAALRDGGQEATVHLLAEHLGQSEKSVRRYLKEFGYVVENGMIFDKDSGSGGHE